ncbi:MAG: hypothetical protein ABIP79_06070 [Chitinophagaceae bacterium]
MKKIFLFLCFVFVSICATAQNNDYTVSFEGMGAIKLGMNKAKLEKLLNLKILLKEIGVGVVMNETIKAKYMGIDMELYLFGDEKSYFLEGISTTSPLFKTIDGIGIGTDQLTIINKYEKHLLIIHPEYVDEISAKTSKPRTIITLANIDNYREAIIFTLVNKKVVAIEVGPTPQFRDRE